jgi:hypothetical protein
MKRNNSTHHRNCHDEKEKENGLVCGRKGGLKVDFCGK